ncbi:hypothetical protein VTK26DRAFT_5397 [Humicola hyalothermophila]
MAGRANRTSQQSAPVPARQNEYFVPRDGIDREVITSDICRYLGNDALVRPGTYESPDGRVTQGYFITAYRNLTSAMIQDLKADSARWEQERRAAAARSAGGGSGGSREQPRGQSDYAKWKEDLRQQQEYEAAYGSSSMDVDYPPAPGPAGNPGYGGQQYPGAAPPPPVSYPPAAYPPQVHAPPPAQYPAQPGYGYPPTPAPTQYSPPPQAGERYSSMAPPPMPPAPYGQDSAAYVHGSNYQASAGYSNAAPTRIPSTMPLASAPPSRTYSAPVSGTPGYGAETDPYAYPPPAGNPANPPFPADALYGRGAAQRQGYAPPPDPQYDDRQNQPLQPATTPTTTAPSQIPSSVAPAPRRERDRDSEPRDRERERERERVREPDHRDYRPPRRDRDDRRHRHQ